MKSLISVPLPFLCVRMIRYLCKSYQPLIISCYLYLILFFNIAFTENIYPPFDMRSLMRKTCSILQLFYKKKEWNVNKNNIFKSKLVTVSILKAECELYIYIFFFLNSFFCLNLAIRSDTTVKYILCKKFLEFII